MCRIAYKTDKLNVHEYIMINLSVKLNILISNLSKLAPFHYMLCVDRGQLRFSVLPEIVVHHPNVD